MTDALTFALAALALLVAPGPTNTMMIVSGASAGFAPSFKLVLAATIGYAAGSALLAIVVGPLASSSHELSVILRVACAVLLAVAAWRLWREGGKGAALDVKPVPFAQVLGVTTFNPKNIVFAFVIIPFLAQGQIAPSLPYLAALALMTIGVTSAWVAGGAVLRAGAGAALNSGIVQRLGAVVLAAFAVMIVAWLFTA